MGLLDEMQDELAAKVTVAALGGKLPKIPLTEYYVGKPCVMQNQVIGRIVGESDQGSWGDYLGFKAYSVPLFSTPHGSVTTCGLGYLGDCDEEQLKKLT